MHRSTWHRAGPEGSGNALAQHSGLEPNPMRPGPRGHAHASLPGRSAVRGAGSSHPVVRHGHRGGGRHHHRRHHGGKVIVYPSYYGLGGYPWWYYPYGAWSPYYWGYWGYPGYYQQQQQKEVPETCCYDEATGKLYCPGTKYDGAPAFAQQTSVYDGRKMSFVSSPSFRRDRWVWHCPDERAPNPSRAGSMLLYPTRRRRNQAAAEAETGAPPLGVELPQQAGIGEQTPSPPPHSGPLPGAHCFGHPSLPNVVCCAPDGIYGKHVYCMPVPYPAA